MFLPFPIVHTIPFLLRNLWFIICPSSECYVWLITTKKNVWLIWHKCHQVESEPPFLCKKYCINIRYFFNLKSSFTLWSKDLIAGYCLNSTMCIWNSMSLLLFHKKFSIILSISLHIYFENLEESIENWNQVDSIL